MKKNIIYLALTIFVLFASSCKKEEKKTESKDTNTKTEKELHTTSYSVIDEKSSIEWTAYKTTDKVPVKGVFKTINIENPKSDVSIEKAINGTKFSIPISSLFTNEPTRDSKLKEFFFGVMDKTEIIKGEFTVTDSKSEVSITMNGITKSIPITLKTEGQEVLFTSTLNLNDWNLQEALESINKVCFDLHKGPDGVSKTWDDAEINARIFILENK